MTKYGYYKEPSDTRVLGLTLLVVALLVVAGYEYVVLSEREKTLNILSSTLDTTKDVLQITQAALQSAHTENDALRMRVSAQDEAIDELGSRLGLAERQINELTPVTKRFAAVGVRSDGTGVVIPLEVKMVGGDGSISVNIRNVDLQSGVQASIRTAVDVAEEYTNKGLDRKDITVSFLNEGPSIVTIDGPSAGGAITATLIAVLQNKTIRNDVLMTGAIEPDGDIGPVGGVTAKAEAADEWGADLFLVPEGETTIVDSLQIVEVETIDQVVRTLLR